MERLARSGRRVRNARERDAVSSELERRCEHPVERVGVAHVEAAAEDLETLLVGERHTRRQVAGRSSGGGDAREPMLRNPEGSDCRGARLSRRGRR